MVFDSPALLMDKLLNRILNRLPWRIIWSIDEKFNHYKWKGHARCVSRWFCDYTDYRTMKDQNE